MNDTKAHRSGQHIIIHTDGACIGNPGPGGWAAIVQLLEGSKELRRKELTGSAHKTTNNQMELTAAIEALKLVKSGKPVVLRSDSEYVVKGMTERLPDWIAKGWRTASKTPVKNRELWEELKAVAEARSVAWEWVRGHNGDPLNEEADRLANEAARMAC
ncbi:ribonuclease HI [Mesorhizobium sp. B2-6-2]|uniref:ribonuclease HI n=1 Tax=Mesorhizobium sp. B2-6-2 TaxID=2589915 RepID=UPI001127479D|nr:ribonuclease HI [Mesorhizobium sp. B2-6-2]TPJ72445.1 ribonuclease HI [Mesorhizobium sp. B2-6-2]